MQCDMADDAQGRSGPKMREHADTWRRADIYDARNDHQRPTASKMDEFGRLPSSKAFVGRRGRK